MNLTLEATRSSEEWLPRGKGLKFSAKVVSSEDFRKVVIKKGATCLLATSCILMLVTEQKIKHSAFPRVTQK